MDGIQTEADFAGVAQLVERLLPKQEVVGSSPISSTSVVARGMKKRTDRSERFRGPGPRIFDNRIESSQFRESFSRLKDFMAKLLRVNGGCLGAERR